MADLHQHIDRLAFLIERERTETAALENARKLGADFYDRMQDEALKSVRVAHWKIVDYLENDVLRYPYFHDRHFARLPRFHDEGTFEESVFIMTKYPDDKDPDAPLLARVIQLVQEGIREAKLRPRIAGEAKYHDWIWDNVELNMLGCGRGVAIVEDRYRKELNPNVAMEWGWMRAMGRPVLFLVEETFKHLRGDIQGMIAKPFSWDRPEETIVPAVVEGLKQMRPL
jgi:hypothetical protein